jgi:hypothetical protein
VQPGRVRSEALAAMFATAICILGRRIGPEALAIATVTQPEVCATALSSLCLRIGLPAAEQRSAAGAQRSLFIAVYKSAAIAACHLPSARGPIIPGLQDPATWAGIPAGNHDIPGPPDSNYNKKQL